MRLAISLALLALAAAAASATIAPDLAAPEAAVSDPEVDALMEYTASPETAVSAVRV